MKTLSKDIKFKSMVGGATGEGIRKYKTYLNLIKYVIVYVKISMFDNIACPNTKSSGNGILVHL